MKLGLAIGYSGATMNLPVERVQLAERLGYDSVWTAEAYGSDAVTPLAYLGAVTERIKLGTGIMQVSARTPANAAMCAGTVDAMVGGGRFLAGLGVSGPQIVEGWYGQPWGRPNKRLRDYVTIMRHVLKREGPVHYEGEEISLPYEGDGSTGLGKPLKSVLHTNPDLPIYLGTGAPANVALTAELADGWLPMGYGPETSKVYQPWIEKGLARSGRRWEDLQIQAGCQVILTDDVQAAMDSLRPFVGLYVGGMGAESKNFHKDMMARRGFPEEADRIQELFLAGKREEAIAAVPDAYLDQGALIGPPDRIAERFRAWQDLKGITGLTLHTSQPEAMELVAKLAECRPREN